MFPRRNLSIKLSRVQCFPIRKTNEFLPDIAERKKIFSITKNVLKPLSKIQPYDHFPNLCDEESKNVLQPLSTLSSAVLLASAAVSPSLARSA
jgi:hypothetical protein